MSEIIYERHAESVVIGPIRLNGTPGAIEVWKDDEAADDLDEFVIFESPSVAYRWIDAFEQVLREQGHFRPASTARSEQ